ncbi:PLP-dependent aminotransferase family protein [Parasedimentitalea maritima]|uniref:Aminotransferase class I/II-fold pyridoxal phosphate-dependent enzyme n=1 Tax=Parasedimentitalea maritima TaxID=2578117 RepID=A0A6A4R8J8_9RHOB|nr:PLP-dependent aminotransferase family protein [Zongyanglinia marina]KAE9628278.1 aminotransferase class I/II-fold pyridoxal phosphate-dependent enzyme [Zongyanglinia marina]
MADLAHLLSQANPSPRYVQIGDGLRNQISEGHLVAGVRLPASRALAQDLGVARSTVVTAYDQLIAEGYLEARQGAGIFVCDVAPIAPTRVLPPQSPKRPPQEKQLLLPGAPDPDIFPIQPWARCVARVARSTPQALVHQDDPFGDPVLRREIAAYAGRWRGIVATADQVIVTSGASEALRLAMELLVSDNHIALESPGYVPTQKFASARGWTINWMPVGAQGAALPKQAAEVTVLTPSHQFPLGGSLPVPVRQAFLQAAAERNGWIIEDDFDSEFRYAGQPVPAMAALDHHGCCVYAGTFSKTFSHSLRLGYLILPSSLITHFRDTLNQTVGGAPITAQRPLAEFMASGQYDRHIRRARRLYAQRYAVAAAALADWPDHLGHFHPHQAGMQIAFHLASPHKEQEMVKAAQADGFSISSLSRYDPGGETQGLLIGFCQSEPEQLKGQIERLRRAIQI